MRNNWTTMNVPKTALCDDNHNKQNYLRHMTNMASYPIVAQMFSVATFKYDSRLYKLLRSSFINFSDYWPNLKRFDNTSYRERRGGLWPLWMPSMAASSTPNCGLLTPVGSCSTSYCCPYGPTGAASLPFLWGEICLRGLSLCRAEEIPPLRPLGEMSRSLRGECEFAKLPGPLRGLILLLVG